MSLSYWEREDTKKERLAGLEALREIKCATIMHNLIGRTIISLTDAQRQALPSFIDQVHELVSPTITTSVEDDVICVIKSVQTLTTENDVIDGESEPMQSKELHGNDPEHAITVSSGEDSDVNSTIRVYKPVHFFTEEEILQITQSKLPRVLVKRLTDEDILQKKLELCPPPKLLPETNAVLMEFDSE